MKNWKNGLDRWEEIFREWRKNNMEQKRKLGAIILAAGQGKRMNVDGVNKVTLQLNNKPIITHIVHFMRQIFIETIVVVVGHAKESVIESLTEEHVLFAEQTQRL